ncbi:MAG: Rpn family recombination-promoting nuclease/putative transposase, partial [Acetatifactor sp.]|nr:Rpn family recombination-promoting nuclease/putative transposase [Acetatifactor sp.]
TGEDYARLKKCIVICVLGFRWDTQPGYHKVYYLRDQDGQLYSDQFEIHVIELNKELTGDRLDDWIKLFRVENMEELEMLQSKNPGVMEAVEEVRTMNLGRRLHALYEEHMRIKRDRLYLRNIAIAEGRAEGLAEGRAEGEATGEAIGDLKRSRQDVLDLLEEIGPIPKDIHKRILAEKDTETLRKWLKTAAKATNFADLRKKMI